MLCEFRNEKMTAKRLIKAMHQNFRLKGGSDSDDKDSVRMETALALGNFPGKCYNCRKPGHKRPDCPEKPTLFSGIGRYQSKCHECGGGGHNQLDIGRKKMKVNGHATRCPRRIIKKLVL